MAEPTPQQYVAAASLTGAWLDSLTHAIESQRAKAAALNKGRVVYITSDKLALIAAHAVTKPRRNNKAPSPLTVAQEISAAVNLQSVQAGAALLGMAEWCGFIVLTDGKRRAGWKAAKEVRLSVPAEAQRAQIEARLIASDVPDARPLLVCPRLVVQPSRNPNDIDPAPLPVGHAVAKALEPIQNTAWRVNRFMLDTLRALAPGEEAAAIAQANHFADDPDAPEFFYRCGFDWRGRIYQQGGRLQYTSGTDAARSLLEFAHGEPLTSDGRTFLAIHVATCAGIRGSLTDRAVWTHTKTDAIKKLAADPFGSKLWQAKQPYRFLAACRAWADVEADPRAPIHLPVTADATASMFQHFAWLLRDEELGRLVNLTPAGVGDAPSDFYVSLAPESEYHREELKALAWMFYGMAPKTPEERAVRKLLKDRAPRAWALYLALRRGAKREAQAARALEWSLPDGFRVRQANRVAGSRKVELYLHTWKKPGYRPLQARKRELEDLLDDRAQARGLPANLIHSLDACLLRAVVREAPGVTRWAVAHDSLGVHPNDGGTLRQAIVEAIECVYGPDLLSELLTVLRCDGVQHPAELPMSMRGGWYTFS